MKEKTPDGVSWAGCRGTWRLRTPERSACRPRVTPPARITAPHQGTQLVLPVGGSCYHRPHSEVPRATHTSSQTPGAKSRQRGPTARPPGQLESETDGNVPRGADAGAPAGTQPARAPDGHTERPQNPAAPPPASAPGNPHARLHTRVPSSQRVGPSQASSTGGVARPRKGGRR